jgi:tetratricopeptide (TPR) repeat protein
MAHNNLASILFDQGKTENAIAEYDQAVCLNPLFFEAHYNLGLALERTGRTRRRSA